MAHQQVAIQAAGEFAGTLSYRHVRINGADVVSIIAGEFAGTLSYRHRILRPAWVYGGLPANSPAR